MNRFPPNLQNLIYKYLAIENTRKVSRLFVNGLRSIRSGFLLKRIDKCCICRGTSLSPYRHCCSAHLNYIFFRHICEICFRRYRFDGYSPPQYLLFSSLYA